jgi:hypothetical protein
MRRRETDAQIAFAPAHDVAVHDRDASAINDRLQRKPDYVEEERHIIREQLDAATVGKKLSFTADQRRRLATAGKLLTPDERRKCRDLVEPATILAWFRQLAARTASSEMRTT